MLKFCLSQMVVIFAFMGDKRRGLSVKASYKEESDVAFKVKLLDIYFYLLGKKVASKDKVVLIHYAMKGMSDKTSKEIVELGLSKTMKVVYNTHLRLRRLGLIEKRDNKVSADILNLLNGCVDFGKFTIVVER